MLLNTENTKGKKVEIFDRMGRRIPGVVSYDTETCEIEMCIYLLQEQGMAYRPLLVSMGEDGRDELFVAKLKIPGTYAVVDGQKI